MPLPLLTPYIVGAGIGILAGHFLDDDGEYTDEEALSNAITGASFGLAPGAGRVVVSGGSRILGTRPVQAVIAAKRPFHEALARSPLLWHPTRMTAPPKIVTESLKWRKRFGLVATGVSAINPMQNIRYASDRDWKRLAINLRYPIVGVPFYDTFISNRLGAPDSAVSPTHHKPTARPRYTGGGRESRSPERFRPGRVSQGTGRRPRRPKAPGRSKCPPGYYWSWKKKTCVKSKYR